MQKMAATEGDPHDHGPPARTADQAAATLRKRSPFPQLALWVSKMSSPAINGFAGATAGTMSGIVTCPLDVIKTKLQIAHQRRGLKAPQAGAMTGELYQGLVGTAKGILREEGLRGFYRGLGPMILGYLPTWAVYMSVYDRAREYFYNNGYNGNDRDKLVARMYSSVIAGACSTTATNPIWVIKTRMMSMSSSTATSEGILTPFRYTSTLDAARTMYRKEGLGVFYSGLAAAMLGLTHVAVQFPLYEYLKKEFTGFEMGEAPPESGKEAHNAISVLMASFISKVCATTATYPHEVLRARMYTQSRAQPESSTNGVAGHHHSQSLPSKGKLIGNTDGTAYRPRYVGVVQTCRIILREEGWRAFYNGMGTNMVRAVPAAMTTMLTYETVKGLLLKMKEEGEEIRKERGLD
jgi:solute carrier family 25 (mitochondrial folate transporter), member 32